MDEPHPELQRMLAEEDELGVPSVAAQTVDAARRQHEQLASSDAGPDVERTWDLEVPSPVAEDPIDLRIYRPGSDGPYPTLLWIHGGGFVLGSLETADAVARSLAVETDCVVVSVGYNLAPEHPFPDQPRECYAALEWTAEHVDTFGGDPDRIAVGGDSAGGNLAAVAALRARDDDGPDLDHQLLVYPVTTDAALPSREANAEGYGLTTAEMEWFDEKYVRHSVDAANPYAYPLKARDLSGLPPATVITAGFDPLLDDGVRYAERLDAAEVDVEHLNYEAMIHGFFGMLDLDIDAAHDAIERSAARLRDSFGT
ncbi:alpha/beta hydrolase [Halomicrobium salinisoli]|uniref:alpha/beta hydrolase n=1 Tax=Halomicrobium salinisoli TaxID=2878391 RepID=UPI001CF077B9|nr:alpha/beta hydrolase [Halomicrobium salinisoli]